MYSSVVPRTATDLLTAYVHAGADGFELQGLGRPESSSLQWCERSLLPNRRGEETKNTTRYGKRQPCNIL